MMKGMKFYAHFVEAYGTCWLVIFILAILTQQNIETGLYGYYGFPLIGLGYAAYRTILDSNQRREIDELRQILSRIETQLFKQELKLSRLNKGEAKDDS